jgi:outer membrane protein assembly factor BamB
MPPRSRRALLQLLAGSTVCALAGCETDPATDEPTGTRSNSPSPTSTPTESPTETRTPELQEGVCEDAWEPTERWRYATGIRAYAPTVTDGVVYFGAGNDRLYAFDAATGSFRWEREQDVRLYGRPLVVGDLVVASGYGEVATYDAASGEPYWRYAQPGAYGQVETNAAVDGERLFFAASNRAGVQPDPADEPYDRLYAVDGGDEEPAWYRELGDSGGTPGVAAADGTVYRATGDGGLWALDAATGETVWSQSVAGDRSFFEPRVGEGAVYVQVDGRLTAVERADGTARWRDDQGYVGDPAVGDGRVYCVAGEELVAVDAGTGERRWRAPLPAADASATDVAGATVYVSVPTAGGSVKLAFDAERGCTRGRYETPAKRTTRVATTDETVFFGGLHGEGAMYALPRPDRRDT